MMANTPSASEVTPTMLFITFSDIKERNQDFVNYYTYDPIQNKEEHLFRRVVTFYPTGMLSKDRKNLYVNRLDTLSNKSYIGLYHWPLPARTGQAPKLLTDRNKIWNVDHLRMNKNDSQIYMRVVQPSHRNAQIATYDVASRNMTVWDSRNQNIEVQNFDYSPAVDQVIALEFSLSEEATNIVNANKRESPIEPQNYHVVLYKSSGEKIREVAAIKKQILDISFSPDAKSALFTATDHYNSDSKYTVYSLDLTNGQITPVFTEKDNYTKIKQAQHSPDGKKIYFLTIKSDAAVLSNQPGRRVRPRILAVYDIETKTISEVWTKEKGTINNFLVLR